MLPPTPLVTLLADLADRVPRLVCYFVSVIVLSLTIFALTLRLCSFLLRMDAYWTRTTRVVSGACQHLWSFFQTKECTGVVEIASDGGDAGNTIEIQDRAECASPESSPELAKQDAKDKREHLSLSSSDNQDEGDVDEKDRGICMSVLVGHELGSSGTCGFPCAVVKPWVRSLDIVHSASRLVENSGSLVSSSSSSCSLTPSPDQEFNLVGPHTNNSLTNEILLCLQCFYGRASYIVFGQIKRHVSKYYANDLHVYSREFLYPAVRLLRRLQKISTDNTLEYGLKKESCWPLSHEGAVVVHLTSIPKAHLHHGDFYLCLSQTNFGHIQLVLRYLTRNGDGVQEWLVLESDFRKLFTMDWIRRMRDASESDLGIILKNCLLAVEDGIRRLRWDDVGISESNNNVNNNSDRLICKKLCSENGSPSDSIYHTATKECLTELELIFQGEIDAKDEDDIYINPAFCHHSLRSPLCTTNSLCSRPKLDQPLTIMDVDYELLNSGIAILPGSRDVRGAAVVYLFTNSSLWHNQMVSSIELARLLMHYYSIPREDVRRKGLTIVSDIRGVSSSTVNVLLETLYMFQANIPFGISVVHVLADQKSETLLYKSPVYEPTESFKLNVLLTKDALYSFVELHQVPAALDGSYGYHHETWVQFHMKLEPFSSNCRSVATHLVSVMQEMTKGDGSMPKTVVDTSQMIEQHEMYVKDAFNDMRLVALQSDGEAIMRSLWKDEAALVHCVDYRDAMDSMKLLHKNLQETLLKLAKLAETRLQKLEQCLQLREFEEECNKIISWLSHQGGDILQRHKTMADNLKAIYSQQKDFEKLYFSAMTHVEKGNDLLEEASMLSQSGNFDEATGYKDLARTLKRHMHDFTEHLEVTRDKIEGTANCYHLLDRSYEWALEAMRYVASMKTENNSTPDHLAKLLKSLELYLKEHPPIEDQTFDAMIEQASKLRNEKLMDQCRVAKSRCHETSQLLKIRQSTLVKAIGQLEAEKRQHECINNNNIQDNGADSLSSDVVNGHPVSVTPSPTHAGNSPSGSDVSRSNSSPRVCDIDSGESSPVSSVDSHSQVSSSQSSEIESPSHTKYDHRHVCVHRMSAPAELSDKTQLRRRSYAGSTSLSLPVRFDNYVSCCNNHNVNQRMNYEQHLMNEGLISKNLDTNISSNLCLRPHSLASTPDSGSFCSQCNRLHNGSNTPCSLHDSHSPNCSFNASNFNTPVNGIRHQKKLFKHSITSPVHSESSCESDSSRMGRDRRTLRTLSMVTGSTESLPSMPEEEEEPEPPELRNHHNHTCLNHRHRNHTDLNHQSQHLDPRQEDVASNGSFIPIKEWTPVPVNTHLHRANRSLPNTNAALDNPELFSTIERKNRRTLSLVMSEMIQTERDYVQALQFVVDNYIPEMNRDQMPQAMRGKRNILFGNIEKIYQFHRQYFLQELEVCARNPFQVGHYFLIHENQFYLYALYNKNKPKSDQLMHEHGKEFFKSKQQELGDKMDLSSYLLKPVQRMGKYALLLKHIIKDCPETDPEYPDLKAAEEMVKFQLRHGNDLLAMDSLRDCDVNLQEQGRLLRQNEFLVWQGRKKSLRHIFLFEDLILFGKTKRGRQGGHDTYIYKYSFRNSDVGLTESYGDSPYKFEIWFRRRSGGDNYILQAPNSEVKNAWVHDISKLLWKQAIKNREVRLTEMASMGVGNKPCMDIKPSADNINDRFVNIAVGSRAARTRNSIAVSSFEHLRNGNKRPHSIISVSSNSSSNSSQSTSSYAVFGTNAIFEQVPDSPRFTRRSFAASSNESGIEPDISMEPPFLNRHDLHDFSSISAQSSRPRSYHEHMKAPPSGMSVPTVVRQFPVISDV